MIRLSQTGGEDGMPMVDREAVMEFVPVGNKQQILERFEARREGQLNEEAAVMEEQMDQMAEMIESLTSEVEKMKQEHDKLAQEKKESQLVQKGYERGQSDSGLTNDEISGIMDSENKLPDEVLQMMETLTDEEMAKLLEIAPDLDQVIEQNT